MRAAVPLLLFRQRVLASSSARATVRRSRGSVPLAGTSCPSSQFWVSTRLPSGCSRRSSPSACALRSCWARCAALRLLRSHVALVQSAVIAWPPSTASTPARPAAVESCGWLSGLGWPGSAAKDTVRYASTAATSASCASWDCSAEQARTAPSMAAAGESCPPAA